MPHGAAQPTAIIFGHTMPLAELQKQFKAGQRGCDSVQNYRGCFYYNRDQDKTLLILPLQLSKLQNPLANGITASESARGSQRERAPYYHRQGPR